MSRKTVLFVDDDAEFLSVLQPYMEYLSGAQWEVLMADNSAAALGFVDSRHVDLAVLDVRMPVVDGMQLLQLLNRKHPQLKKAVLTGFVDEGVRSIAFNSGAELMLEKPTDAAGFEALFAALNELVDLPTEQGFRGMLRRVGLEDIIQMECLSRHSLILEVVAQGQRGRLYIRSGALIHAEFGETVGEPALQRLLTLSGGEFHHLAFTEPQRKTLEGSWEFLLMEAVRQRDEAAGEVPPADESPAPVTAEAPAQPIVAERTTAEPPASAIPPPVINELVVCSEKGELLYVAQSTNPQARCDWCLAIAQAGARLQALLPVGDLERVEFVSVPGRMIVRLQDGPGVFIHANCD